MKKLLVIFAVVFAVVYALTVYAGKTKVTVKEETKGDTTTVTAKEKTPEKKEVVKATVGPGGVAIHDVTKHKHGDLWKDDVKFKSYKDGDDYVYLEKEDKTYRVKFRKTAKSPLMKLKKGDQVNIVSTRPLTGTDVQDYITLHSIEKQ